jgi:tetratricopeptide (TPR) repeat protein
MFLQMIFLTSCLLWANGLSCWAAADAWYDYSNKGYSAFDHDRYSEAAGFFQHAIEIAETTHDAGSGVGESHLGTSLENLADVLVKQAKLSDAEALYKRALALFEEKATGYGRDFIVTDTGLDTTPDLARIVDKLAAFYVKQGKYESAEPLYRQALQIWNTRMWGNTPEFAGRLVKLAQLYKDEGKGDQAKTTHRTGVDDL